MTQLIKPATAMRCTTSASRTILQRAGQSLVSFNGYAGNGQQIEQIQLVTGDGEADDDDDNTIYFGPTYGFFSNRMDFYIDGGGGNDLFTNYNRELDGGNMDDQFDATIVGGAGTDTIALDDTEGCRLQRTRQLPLPVRLPRDGGHQQHNV